MVMDGLIAFFSAVGLATVVWLVSGVLLGSGRRGVPGLLLVLPLREDAPAMEEDVRQLRRAQNQLPGAALILVDCGLTEDAKQLADFLASREKDALLVDAKDFQTMKL